MFEGLAHIIEMRKVLDLKIHLKPSYLVVPQTGFYHENSNLLILDFGTFQVYKWSLLISTEEEGNRCIKREKKKGLSCKTVWISEGKGAHLWKNSHLVCLKNQLQPAVLSVFRAVGLSLMYFNCVTCLRNIVFFDKSWK